MVRSSGGRKERDPSERGQGARALNVEFYFSKLRAVLFGERFSWKLSVVGRVGGDSVIARHSPQKPLTCAGIYDQQCYCCFQRLQLCMAVCVCVCVYIFPHPNLSISDGHCYFI